MDAAGWDVAVNPAWQLIAMMPDFGSAVDCPSLAARKQAQGKVGEGGSGCSCTKIFLVRSTQYAVRRGGPGAPTLPSVFCFLAAGMIELLQRSRARGRNGPRREQAVNAGDGRCCTVVKRTVATEKQLCLDD